MASTASCARWRTTAGIALHAGLIAAGNVFLPQDQALEAHCRETLARELGSAGLRVAGVRDVPVDPSVCGELARVSLPRIAQVFVESDGDDADAFERALFLARKRAEQALGNVGDFYVVSLSVRLLGYKGMVLPKYLQQLFPDLAHPRLEARAVLFHQRFSTNTLPRWPLAQPFRFLAHNGEINTIEGNRNWAQARKAVWKSQLLDLGGFAAWCRCTAPTRSARQHARVAADSAAWTCSRRCAC